MLPIVNKSGRAYRSPLREEQAKETRERILDAALQVLARGLADLSIPAIAREAGVSIPTVYRNFRTKRKLLEAIYPYSVRRARTGEVKPPTSIAVFGEGVRLLFERLESLDDIERAAFASPGAEAVRHVNIESRRTSARRAVDAIAPRLSGEDRERLARLAIVLTTSATARMLREHLGLSLDEAVDDVEWAIRAVIAGRSLEPAS
jgi:AcrR family transcriptional regulator